MDLKQIEKLMIAMKESRIKRLVLKKEEFEIEIESESTMSLPSAIASVSTTHIPSEVPQLVSPSMTLLPKVISDSHPPKTSEKAEGIFIPSPMVGTFYTSPSPDDPPFVKVGDVIHESSVVCIIEAMKVMNEVKAGMAGVVVEILLKNGEPVEFGTHMFRITSS